MNEKLAKSLTDAQKSAMIKFCLDYAGELKYVPVFNKEGICTVNAFILKSINARKSRNTNVDRGEQ